MTPTNSQKQVRAFIGLVKYYRYMWAIHSHLLQLLTALTSNKVNFKLIDVEHKVFDYIKHIFSHDTLLAYPDFNTLFDIHTDNSDFHLGALISQCGKPIDFYTHKLTGPQTWYTVTEKQLLSIVQTLKEFRTILLVQQLKLYTNHKI